MNGYVTRMAKSLREGDEVFVPRFNCWYEVVRVSARRAYVKLRNGVEFAVRFTEIGDVVRG